MDLFDLGNYFGSYVPVQARCHPLLKHALCACAAKHLGRARGAKAVVGGICSQQASMELYTDSTMDWEYEGAFHYDRSISLLMGIMQQDQHNAPLSGNEEMLQHWEIGTDEGPSNSLFDEARAQLQSDEVVAATAILCVYEFLSATGAAWSRHLNGTKSLLDIAEATLMPLGMPPAEIPFLPKRRIISKARKATFWNFARQDYVAACKPFDLIHFLSGSS